MASNFHIQKPYVLSRLPSLATQETTRYWAAEVFGQQAGSKKRKRTELSIGIDHDAVNLYNIPSGQIITSYPIPPQSSLTCPPCSIRWKPAVGKDALRYTYIATESSQFGKRSLNLFKDAVAASGSATSTTVSQAYSHPHPVVHLSTAEIPSAASILETEQPTNVLIAVAKDGSIYCYDGETLKERWQTSPSVLLQELPSATGVMCEVEFVQSALAADVLEGIFEGKQDAFSCFSQEIQRDGFHPYVLVLITSVSAKSRTARQRYVHILTLNTGNQGQPERFLSVLSVPIPSPVGILSTQPKYRLDPRSGSLTALHDGKLYDYAVRGSLPKFGRILEVNGVVSCLPLSKTSVLTSRDGFLEVYNPVYRSLQTTVPVELDADVQGNPTKLEFDTAETKDSAKDDSCELLTYFAGLEIAVGLKGSLLVAIQVEPPKTRNTKRRADGLLVDSLGRGLSQDHHLQKRGKMDQEPVALAGYLPGSLTEKYWAEWRVESQRADELVKSEDFPAFDKFMALKFKGTPMEFKTPTKRKSQDPQRNTDEESASSGNHETQEKIWSPASDDCPQVDRRWVLYAISKVFTWNSRPSGSDARISCVLPNSWTFNYLVDAGHLSTSNLKSAFKDELNDLEDVELILNEEIPRVLVHVDPTMELLVHYLYTTKLGAVELLTAIRLVMGSLGLVQDAAKAPQRLLRSGDDEQDPELAAIGMELDRAEEELQVTEYYYLGDQSSTRAQALSAAFSKLEACPAISTVQGIRRLYRPEETLSLINVLRTELIRDGWTTRYLDTSYVDEDNGDEAPNGSIRVIADLLCRCIDSVGPSGWLANDALLASLGGQHETADFFEQLKMEVSAALEGIEEAVRLRAILTQAVKYGASLQSVAPASSSTPGKVAAKSKATTIKSVSASEDGRMLPFGLKSKNKVSSEKIVSGGEIVQRSKREKGLLLSKKVGPYSVERISI